MSQRPKAGEFYYHFKHDPKGPEWNYTYKIVGISQHTETGEILVVYKPLYKSESLKESGSDFSVRPLDMFMSNVERENYKGPRFIKITDVDVIGKLENYGK